MVVDLLAPELPLGLETGLLVREAVLGLEEGKAASFRPVFQLLPPVVPARAVPLVLAGRLFLRSLELPQPGLELIHFPRERIALGAERLAGLLLFSPDRRMLGLPSVALGAGRIAFLGQAIAQLPGIVRLDLELRAKDSDLLAQGLALAAE